MRLFIGIPVPEDYVRIIGRIQDAWRPRLASRLSWVQPELAHVTLKFLGEVADSRVPAIRAAMRAAVVPAFRFQGGSGGVFSRKSPRVVWIDVARGHEECQELFAMLEKGLIQAGFAAERRPFVPHLTVARIKSPASGDDWSGLLRDLDAPWPECIADRIVLWRSILDASGSRYRVIEDLHLGNSVS